MVLPTFFEGGKIFNIGYLECTLSVRVQRNLALLWFCGSGQLKHIPEFHELWSGVLQSIPCGNMHQSFTGTLVKCFFNNFPMFTDSFSILSIHCVAWGLAFCTRPQHRVTVQTDSRYEVLLFRWWIMDNLSVICIKCCAANKKALLRCIDVICQY